MSAVELTNPPLRRNRRRKGAPVLDLNVPPAEIGAIGESTSSLGSMAMQPNQQAPPAPIDVDAIDDDVLSGSPRAFAQAVNNPRRRPREVIDLDSEARMSTLATGNNHKRRVISSSRPFCKQIIELHDAEMPLEQSKSSPPLPPPPPPPPPPEMILACPICMCEYVESVTTKCGHIFCQRCVKAAIATVACRGKCPTCRKKVTGRDLARIYLPTPTPK